MIIKDSFLPVEIPETKGNDRWSKSIAVYDKEFPDINSREILLIFIAEAGNREKWEPVRKHIYSLTKKELAEVVADLGDYMWDEKNPKADEEFGFFLSELLEMGKIPIIIGGRQQTTYGQFLAYDFLKKTANLLCLDNTIDFSTEDEDHPEDASYLYKILLKDPSYLYTLCMLGYQTYLTETDTVKLFEKNFFDLQRLGILRENISDAEPLIRSSDLISLDLAVVKQSDAPGNDHPSPNGVSADEICQIARYAGLSDNLTSLGIYEYKPLFDSGEATARLISQIIWFFTEGYTFRDPEKIFGNEMNFTRYITTDKNNTYQISFYKSKKTGRWWMEAPATADSNQNRTKLLIPCSYNDYNQATSGELPDRWWRALQRAR